MKEINFTFKDPNGAEIFVYKWLPENGEIKGVVQISHGMAETAVRYSRFAAFLVERGYAVYANDHRGHGKTAKSPEEVGHIGEDGFNWMVKDMRILHDTIVCENPGKQVFIFGHSMGSLLSQRYISLFGDSIDGVILSGTCGKQGIVLDLGIAIARTELKRKGPRVRSNRLNNLTFGSYNRGIKNAVTKFDWLSRDKDEVEKYINDPYCGGVFSTGFFYDFLMGYKELHKMENMKRIPKELPIYIFSGEKDPVGKNCKTVSWLIKEYKKLGIKDVSYKFYEDGRHEMLNEINRDEVMNDVINWLDKHLKK